jgi:hypothetical protein
MNDDKVIAVTAETWGSRLSQSFKSIVFGIAMVLGAMVLLFWNEGRAVDRIKALAAGAGAVVAGDAATVLPANEGKLVYVNGQVSTGETLVDAELGVRQFGIVKLQRKVEAFQWIEERRSESKETLGGGKETVTTTTYKKDWSDRLQDSSGFQKPNEHRNPAAMAFEKAAYQATNVRLGAFRLGAAQVSSLNREEDFDLGQQTLLPAIGGKRVHRQGNTVFLGNSPSEPQVGDLRIRYTVVRPARISVVAQQHGDSFVPFETETGSVSLLQYGDIPAPLMFKSAEESNATMTWLLRMAGIGLMFLGFRTILAPLRTLAAVVPLVARIVDVGLAFASFILAGSISLIVIAIAWLWARPLIGGALLMLGVGLPLLLRFVRRDKSAAATTPA